MNGRRAAAGFGIAVLGSQAGHLLAYQLRFGGAAQQIQSSGAHAYFPALTKSVVGLAAASLLGCLFLIGLARILGGRRDVHEPRISLLRLVAALFTVQLALFVGQEIVEAQAAGIASGPGVDLVLWGMIGQLPVALVGAVALRWLFVRVERAVAGLKALLTAPVRVPLPAAVLVPVWTPGWAAGFVRTTPAGSFTRRGPPPSSF